MCLSCTARTARTGHQFGLHSEFLFLSMCHPLLDALFAATARFFSNGVTVIPRNLFPVGVATIPGITPGGSGLLTGYPSCRLSAPGCLPNASFSQLSVIAIVQSYPVRVRGLK